MNDLKPLPAWRQKWRAGRIRRGKLYASLRKVGAKAASLAVSGAGAILIAYGVYSVFEPAGLVVGGILCWVLQWSHAKDGGAS